MKFNSLLSNNKRKIIVGLTLLIVFFFVVSCTFLPQCAKGDGEITGEKLGNIIKEIDDGVKVSRERVGEFEKLEKEDFETITPDEILELISFNYEYTTQEDIIQDANIVSADFVDGRSVMVIRFSVPGKIEPFFLQFQSNLYKQGYNFNERLRYSDVCNSFVDEEGSKTYYLLKRFNYLIALIK